MAPKKKGNKRQDEDWEAELGESAPTVDTPTNDQTEDGAEDGEEAPVGGLMAALRKNKEKKKKKGKPTNDFVEGEDAADLATDLASKQPEEGNFDEDDVFAGKPKKPIKVAPAPAAEPEEGEFRVKSKKEKEKEKKEREKQRKKEQVCLTGILSMAY